MGNGGVEGPLPLLSLNHLSLVCKSVESSVEFYSKVLGFHLVKRPSTFDFEGAWLFNYGVGIHLLKCKSVDDIPQKSEINPRDNHVSFQCTDVVAVEKKLQDMKIKFEKRVVEEGGVYVDQIFFHDPDGYMIEICNCDNIPVVPLVDSDAEPPSNCVNRSSTTFWYNMPKTTAKVDDIRENFLEISLVDINPSPLQRDFKVEGCARSQVEAIDDMKPLFLDIMNFYL